MTTPQDEKDLPVGQETSAEDGNEIIVPHKIISITEAASAPNVDTVVEAQAEIAVASVRTETSVHIQTAQNVDAGEVQDVRQLGQPEDMTREGLLNKTQKRLEQLLQQVANLKAMVEAGDVEGLKKDKNILLELISRFVSLGFGFNPDDFTFKGNPLEIQEAEAAKLQKESKVSYHLQHNDWMMAKLHELLNLDQLSAAQEKDLVRICMALLGKAERTLVRKMEIVRYGIRDTDFSISFPMLPEDFPIYDGLAHNMDVHCYQIERGKGKPEIEILFPRIGFDSLQDFEQKVLNTVNAALGIRNPDLPEDIDREFSLIDFVLRDYNYDSLKKLEQKVDEMVDDVIKECRAPQFKKIKTILFGCASLKALEEKYKKRLVDTKEVLLECGYSSADELKQKIEEIEKKLGRSFIDYNPFSYEGHERHVVTVHQQELAISALLEPLYRAMRKRGYSHYEICAFNGIPWNF